MTTLDLATLLVHLKLNSTNFQQGADQAGKQSKSFQQSLGNSLISVKALQEGLDLAKKAFDFGKEGAQILKLEQSFDSLAQSVDTTADVLMGQLRASTAGMVADTELMSAANRFLAMNLAETGDEAAELANVAVTLGSAFGRGANQSLEEFALLLANQSIPRLDTFGISAASVRGRIAELQAATPGLSRETAFMKAVMDEAAISMDRLGGSIQTDAFTGFEVAQKNLTDTLKTLAAEGLTPILEFFTKGIVEAQNIIKGYSKEAESTIETTLAQANSFEEVEEALAGFIESGKLYGGLGVIFTNTSGATAAGVGQAAIMLAQAAENQDQFNEAIIRNFGSMANFEKLTGQTAEQFFDYNRMLQIGDESTIAFTASLEAVAAALGEDGIALLQNADAQREFNRVVYEASPAYDEFQDKLVQTDSFISEQEGRLRGLQQQHDQTNQALRDGVAAQEAYNAAVAEFNESLKQNFLSALDSADGIGFYNESMDELGAHTAYVSNLTSQQTSDLGDLQAAYDKAADKLHDYELGIAGTGLTQEQLSERMDEQRAIMEALGPQIDTLNAVGGEYVSWTTEATVNQDAVNRAIFDAVAATDIGAAGLAIMGGALGLYSEEAVNAALQSAFIQEKIDALAPTFDGTAASALAIQEEVMGFIESLQGLGPAAEGAATAASTATATLSEHDAALAEKLGIFDEQATTASETAVTAFGDIEEAASTHMPTASQIVDEQAAAMLTSVEENMEGIVSATGVNLEEAVTTAEGYVVQFGAVGTNIGQTMTSTLLAEGGALSAAAAQIVADALAAAEAAAEVQSPSVRAIRLSNDIVEGLVMGLLSGQSDLDAVAQLIIDGTFDEMVDGILRGQVDVEEAIEDVIAAVFDTVGDTIGAARRIGGAAEFFAGMLVDPAEAALESLEEQLERSADSIAEQMGGFLPDLSGDLDSLIASAEAAGDLKLAEELRAYQALQQERNAAEAEYIAQQEKLLALQEQQQQLAFLQSQLDLIQMLQQAGLNPATVLEGITLGLDASADDLLAASQAAMAALIAQANAQLGQAQGAAAASFGLLAGAGTFSTGVGFGPAFGGPPATAGFGNGQAALVAEAEANGGQVVHLHIHGDVYGWDDFEARVLQIASQRLGQVINLRARV